jgi:hypothetical protein
MLFSRRIPGISERHGDGAGSYTLWERSQHERPGGGSPRPWAGHRNITKRAFSSVAAPSAKDDPTLSRAARTSRIERSRPRAMAIGAARLVLAHEPVRGVGAKIHPVAESPPDVLLLAVTAVGRTADGRSVWLEVRSGTEKDGTKAGALPVPRRVLMTLFSSQSIGCFTSLHREAGSFNRPNSDRPPREPMPQRDLGRLCRSQILRPGEKGAGRWLSWYPC